MAQTDNTPNITPGAVVPDAPKAAAEAPKTTPEGNSELFTKVMDAAKKNDRTALDALITGNNIDPSTLRNAKGQTLLEELTGFHESTAEAEKSAKAILLLARYGIDFDAKDKAGKDLRTRHMEAGDSSQLSILDALGNGAGISMGIRADGNKDKVISEDEFASIMKGPGREKFLSAIDKDGNGVSSQEMESYIRNSGLNFDDPRIGGIKNAVNNMGVMFAKYDVKITDMNPVAFAKPVDNKISEEKLATKTDITGPGIG